MIVLSLAIGFILGWLALRALVNYKMRLMLDSIVNSPSPQKKETKKVDIDLVKIKDVVYAYSRENPQFLAQGYTRLEVVENLRRRFPDTTFMASPSNLKEVGFNDPI